MALVRVDYPTTLSTQADFSKHGDLIEVNYLDKSHIPADVVDGNIPQGAVFQVGGVVYQADSDTAITGTVSDYVRITADGATATAEYAADLTGVEWAKQWNGYYDAQNRLYLFDEGKALAESPAISAVFGKYLMQMKNGDVNIGRDANVERDVNATGKGNFTGKVSAAAGTTTADLVRGDRTITAGTGLSGGGNLSSNKTINMDYLMDQNVRTTDAVTFATVNTGYGFNNLYAMNQNVRATDSPTFNNLTTNDIDCQGVLKKSKGNPDLLGGGRAAGFYTGSTQDETDLPIGSIIGVELHVNLSRNASISLYLSSNSLKYTSDENSSVGELDGIWRSRGLVGGGYYIFQRVS